MALVQKCVHRALTFTNKIHMQQIRIRHYPRWTHRRPIKVYESEEQENLERRNIDSSNQTIKEETVLKDADPDYLAAVAEIKSRISKPNESASQQILKNIKEKNIKTNYKIGKDFISEVSYKHLPGSNTVSDGNDYEGFDFESETTNKTKQVNLRKPLKMQPKKIETTDMIETVIDKDGNLIYTKMKNKDNRVTSLFVDIRSNHRHNWMLLEGKRLIKEALLKNLKLEYLLFSRKADIDFFKSTLPSTGAKLYKMPYNEMKLWSSLSTPPGVMGIFKIPSATNFCSSNTLPLTVICDTVREPGNLGAILRTSAAVGCEKLLLTKGCTNIWDEKVLRSGSGSHFKLNFETKVEFSKLQDLIPKDSNVFIADNKLIKQVTAAADSSGANLIELICSIPVLPYYSIDYRSCKNIVVIVGGETEGICEESYKLAAEFKGVRVNIPLDNDVESLNTGTALGIIVFEIKRQLLLDQAKPAVEAVN